MHKKGKPIGCKFERMDTLRNIRSPMMSFVVDPMRRLDEPLKHKQDCQKKRKSSKKKVILVETKTLIPILNRSIRTVKCFL